MVHISLRGGQIFRSEPRGVLLTHPLGEVDVAAEEMTPVIDALKAVGADLAQENIDAAWVDLDNAELELRCHESRAMTPQPALGKALGAVERARESLAIAETAQASADIDKAIVALSRS